MTFFPIIPNTGRARSKVEEEVEPHMMVREAFSAPFTPVRVRGGLGGVGGVEVRGGG